jgi:hypothetical protein
MQWAANLASQWWLETISVDKEVPPLPELLSIHESAAKAWTTKRDSGASTGSEAHELVELLLKGKADELDAKLETASTEALNAYEAFYQWYTEVEPNVINVEEVIYSKNYKYAGTYDCMLEIDGKIYLCDFKTTNISRTAPQGVYPENFLQLGAYAYAHMEQLMYESAQDGSDLLPVDGLMVISGKKNGKLDIVTNEDVGMKLEECQYRFLEVVDLFNFMQETGRRLRV